MTIINSNLLIDSAINDFIGAGKSPYKQGIANRIQNEMHEDIVDNATKCPKQAIYKAMVRNNLENRGTARESIAYFDISFYGFVQTIMDKICWKARRLANNRITETDLDTANGIDFTMDAASDIGIDGSNTSTIAEAVTQAFDELTIVQAYMGQKMGSNNDLDALHMFAPSSPQDDGSWKAEVKLDNWDEVLSELNRIAEELAEKETMETLDDANNMNFDVTKAA